MMDQTGDVLEVGCYLGENAGKSSGAKRYVGIDISDVAIAKADKKFSDARTSFYCVDANYLERLEGQFDYVFGNGVLHHLELSKFSSGLSKKMREGASAVFMEPLEGPFWLRWFRMLTPWLRTEDEHPFDEGYMDILRENFVVKLEYFCFFRPLLPILFFNWRPVIQISARLDKLIMKTKFGRKNAWLVVISLSGKDT